VAIVLQGSGTATAVNRALQFYISVNVATDSRFPFSGDDPYVVRTVDDAIVITPPDCDREELTLPPIEDDVLTEFQK
jgi:hypothetical protein